MLLDMQQPRYVFVDGLAFKWQAYLICPQWEWGEPLSSHGFLSLLKVVCNGLLQEAKHQQLNEQTAFAKGHSVIHSCSHSFIRPSFMLASPCCDQGPSVGMYRGNNPSTRLATNKNDLL